VLPPNNNFTMINPQLVDPQNGDYQLEPGSPAYGYGCLTFSGRKEAIPKKNIKEETAIRRDEIEVGGIIEENTIWNADTIRVVSDITINPLVNLSVSANSCIEFQGYYKIDVKGSFTAIGSSLQKIMFTIPHPELFTFDDNQENCWAGINFSDISSQNDESKFEYCIFECAKASIENPNGGTFYINDYSKINVQNSIIKTSFAQKGGAVFYKNYSSPVFFGNLLMDCKAQIAGSAFYVSYSYGKLINNTIINNTVLNIDDNYATATIHTLFSKPWFYNNIIFNNECEYFEQFEILENKKYYTQYNDISSYANVAGNINQDPLFEIDSGYIISDTSPCIDAGTTEIYGISYPEFDLLGNPRITNGSIDMGAVEFLNDSFVVQNILPEQLNIFCYPNPFNPSTTITFETTNFEEIIQADIYNIKGQHIREYKIENSIFKTNAIVWNGTNQSDKPVVSGIYFIKLQQGSKYKITKCALIK